MSQTKDVFRLENQIREYQKEAGRELENAVKYQNKEISFEEEVERLLEKLEELDEAKLEKLRSDEESKKICNNIMRELETARKNLRQENLKEVHEYLKDVKKVLQKSNVTLPGEDDKNLFFVKVAISKVETAISNRQSEVELKGETEDLLKRMERLEEKEIEKLKQSFSEERSDEEFEMSLENEFTELLERTEQVQQNIQDRNYKEALQYVKKVGSILDTIEYDLDTVNNLEQKYKLGYKELEGGSNSTVYTLKNHPDRLIKFHKSLKHSSKIKKFIDQVPDEVNIAPIIEVGLFEGEAAEIIKRAPGKEVGKIYTNRAFIASIPQKHYDKLVEDTRILVQYGLNPDDSMDNLFYDKNEGFTWIDPWGYDIKKRINDGYRHKRIDFYNLVVSRPSSPDEEKIENMETIMQKLIKAAPNMEEEIRSTHERYVEKARRYDQKYNKSND